MSLSIETIKNRVSVRTFNKSAISESVIKEVRDYINKVDNPLRIPIEFQILDAKEHSLSSPVIIGADTYVAAKYKKVLLLDMLLKSLFCLQPR